MCGAHFSINKAKQKNLGHTLLLILDLCAWEGGDNAFFIYIFFSRFLRFIIQLYRSMLTNQSLRLNIYTQ